VLRRKLSLVIYDAALEYGRRLRRWLTVKRVATKKCQGGSRPIHPPSVAYSGMGVEAATMRKWGVEIDRVDTAVKKISVDGFNAVRMLTVAERGMALQLFRLGLHEERPRDREPLKPRRQCTELVAFDRRGQERASGDRSAI
jgi:hypothetical protein